jgi:hypothetical protein
MADPLIIMSPDNAERFRREVRAAVAHPETFAPLGPPAVRLDAFAFVQFPERDCSWLKDAIDALDTHACEVAAGVPDVE